MKEEKLRKHNKMYYLFIIYVQKLIIMTEPCETESYYDGFIKKREFSTTNNVRSLSIDKYNIVN